MKLQFKYPYLATELTPNGKSQYCLLPAFGSAEIPELSSAEVPVAAVVKKESSFEDIKFRYINGMFYCRRTDGPERTAKDVITETMMAKFANYLVDQRQSSRRVSAGKKQVHKDMLTLLITSKRSSMLENPGQLAGREKALEAVDQWVFNSEVTKNPIVHHKDWSQVAEEIAQSMVIIDGQLWLPTTQPTFWECMGLSDRPQLLSNLDAFDSTKGPPGWLPTPYGTGVPGIRGLARINISQSWDYFWNSDWKCVSFLEVSRQKFTIKGRKAEVFIPEAFSADISAQLMDRMARLSVVLVAERMQNLPMMHEKRDGYYRLMNCVRALKLATRHQEVSENTDNLATLLMEFDTIVGEGLSNGQRPVDQNDWLWLREGIQDALEKWDNRKIDMNTTFATHNPPARF